MDLHLGEDLYESFVEYQTRMLREFDNMATPYKFQVIDASQTIEAVFAEETKRLEPLLQLPHLPSRSTQPTLNR